MFTKKDIIKDIRIDMIKNAVPRAVTYMKVTHLPSRIIAKQEGRSLISMRDDCVYEILDRLNKENDFDETP